jgi:hypothetical protein
MGVWRLAFGVWGSTGLAWRGVACNAGEPQATPPQRGTARKSTVTPMAACPIPVPPVRSSIISVSVRSVIVTGRIVGGTVKHWHWKRNRESDENSSLGLRLEQHRHGKNKRKDQKRSSHMGKLPDEPADHWLPSAAFLSIGTFLGKRIGGCGEAGRRNGDQEVAATLMTLCKRLMSNAERLDGFTKSNYVLARRTCGRSRRRRLHEAENSGKQRHEC